MTKKVMPILWKKTHLQLIDQRKLPIEEVYVEVRTLEDTFDAIEKMVVRGAPLIGFTALFGLVVHVKNNTDLTLESIRLACDYLCKSRPTAVNLAYELERAFKLAEGIFRDENSLDSYTQKLEEFAIEQMNNLHQNNLAMAKLASKDLKSKFGDKKLRLMTLCNTGALACGPMGTALGVIEHVFKEGRVEHVYASETRPYLQGSRLTAFELCANDIPHSVTVEGAFSYLLSHKLVDAVFIGADRIARNGDTANKIGSSSLAIVCKYYGVPFYVVAPTSSFDLNTEQGEDIEIELRSEEEILAYKDNRIAPMDSSAFNPSFDITDHDIIEAIICENGLITHPNSEKVVSTVKGML
jgi:methylthioribose-1-phosphate isomerase